MAEIQEIPRKEFSYFLKKGCGEAAPFFKK